MSFTPRDEATLLDIERAARLILNFAHDLNDEEDLWLDLRTQSAVLHQLMILGEAVKRLSSAFRSKHPHIRWRRIAGMRDNLIHEYDEVDLHEVWNVVQRDIPELLRQLEPLLPKRDE